jgi:hypothetical protein
MYAIVHTHMYYYILNNDYPQKYVLVCTSMYAYVLEYDIPNKDEVERSGVAEWNLKVPWELGSTILHWSTCTTNCDCHHTSQ